MRALVTVTQITIPRAIILVVLLWPSQATAQSDSSHMYFSYQDRGLNNNNRYHEVYYFSGIFDISQFNTNLAELGLMFEEYIQDHYEPMGGPLDNLGATPSTPYSDYRLAVEKRNAEHQRLEFRSVKVVITEWTPRSKPERFVRCHCKPGTYQFADSAVFPINENISLSTIEHKFFEFLNETYRWQCDSTSGCSSNTYDELYSIKNNQIEYLTQSVFETTIVQTGWRPEGISETKPLSDFYIIVPEHDRAVRVCVRDHECEDGDRVRVTVNGRTVFNGEIVNDWECKGVPVNDGMNSIDLYAINGSGRKGNCSYRDVNSGQIRVEGKSFDTKDWKHRGGAGSSAHIVVTVR